MDCIIMLFPPFHPSPPNSTEVKRGGRRRREEEGGGISYRQNLEEFVTVPQLF